MLHKMAGKVDAWAARHADHPPDRNPKLIFLLLATAAAMFPVVVGEAGPQVQHPVLIMYAALGIMVGCVLCMVGQLIPWRDLGCAIEIAGCIVLGTALLAYGLTAGTGANLPARSALTYGLGFGSYARAVQIALYVRGRVIRERVTP